MKRISRSPPPLVLKLFAVSVLFWMFGVRRGHAAGESDYERQKHCEDETCDFEPTLQCGKSEKEECMEDCMARRDEDASGSRAPQGEAAQ